MLPSFPPSGLIAAARRASGFLPATLAIALALTALLSHAEYPDRPIRLLVPYAPGGTTDAISRMVGQKLSERIGQPVVVDNKPGGAEQIAMNVLKSAPADGYTLVISNVGGLSINPSLYGSKLSYDPHKDLVPISLIASLPSIFFVHPSLPVKTVDELTDHLRKNPESVSYASSGPGQGSHLAMELYKSMAKVDANHIPYKGGAPALQDLAAGHVQLMIAIGAEGMPFASTGKLRALAVTTPTPSPLFPDLPPAARSRDLAGFELQTWYGYVAKAGTPPAIVDKLHRAITDVLNEPEIRKKMKDMGVEVLAGTPRELTTRMDADTVRWKAVIERAHIKVD